MSDVFTKYGKKYYCDLLNIDEMAYFIKMLTTPRYIQDTLKTFKGQYKACYDLCDTFKSTEDIYLNSDKFEELETLKNIVEKLERTTNE